MTEFLTASVLPDGDSENEISGPAGPCGGLADWLGGGLQIRAGGFDSRTYLQTLNVSLTYEDWAKVVEDPFAVQDLGPNELRELLNGTDTPEP